MSIENNNISLPCDNFNNSDEQFEPLPDAEDIVAFAEVRDHTVSVEMETPSFYIFRKDLSPSCLRIQLNFTDDLIT